MSDADPVTPAPGDQAPFLPPVATPVHQAGTSIAVAAIRIPRRIREVDAAWVEALAASFEDKGMDTPIIVRPIEWDPLKDGAAVLPAYELVAGAHRLAAATLLEWATIRAVVRQLDDDEARMVEIDENLMRRELHVLDRAIFLFERKRLYEARNPATKHGGAPKSQTLRLSTLPPRFTEDAAAATGFSERAIQLAIQLATNLDEEVIRTIRGLPIADNQAALLSLSKETPPRQRTLAAQLRDGVRTIAQAAVAAGFEEAVTEDPQKTYLGQLERAWDLATPVTRATFLASIDAAYLTVPPQAPFKAETPSPKPSRAGRKPGKARP